MNISSLRRLACTAALGAVASFAGVSAHAGDVRWSIGIDAPLYPGSVRTEISNAPRVAYYPPPRVFLPPQPHAAGWTRPVYHVEAARPYARSYHRAVHRAHWNHRRHHGDCDD